MAIAEGIVEGRGLELELCFEMRSSREAQVFMSNIDG